MAALFAPVAPRLREIAEGLEPQLPFGARFTASAINDLHQQLLGLAVDARAQEALASAQEVVSRRLFAVAGAMEKHLCAPAVMDPDDLALLHGGLVAWAEAMEALPEPEAVDEIRWGALA